MATTPTSLVKLRVRRPGGRRTIRPCATCWLRSVRPLIGASVVPLFADDPHAGSRPFNLPSPPDELPPTPPVPHLGARRFPLQHRDVPRVAAVLVAVLFEAEVKARGRMDVAAALRAPLGVGHWLMAEPADPHLRISIS